MTDQNVHKLLRIVDRTATGSISRSDLTRRMISSKLGDQAEREALIQYARDAKLLNVGREIQFNKAGQNPLVYRITKKGVDTIQEASK